MGNKMCGGGRRHVAERLTRPQRISKPPSDVDYKKLRKLILSEKLAPCFDAVDSPPNPSSSAVDLEECPICFFYFPSLNRSRCCAKGICTECFLQMKPSRITRSAQCPFCKTSCYAVEYRGARTEEEKDMERAEEQKVIEAKMRMQSESQAEERVMNVDETQSLVELLPDYGLNEVEDSAQAECHGVQESTEVDISSDPNTCITRHEELDVDWEEIMVMEAIWRSLQDSRLCTDEKFSLPSTSQGEHFSLRSLAEGVATTIATLAKHDNLQAHISDHPESVQNDADLYETRNCEYVFSSTSGVSNVERGCRLATELNE